MLRTHTDLPDYWLQQQTWQHDSILTHLEFYSAQTANREWAQGKWKKKKKLPAIMTSPSEKKKMKSFI